jgi:hypothetical protein
MRRRAFLLTTAAPLFGAPAVKPSTSSGPICRVTGWLGEAALAPAQIQATVDGKPAQVTAVRDPATPLLIHLIMDLTGDPALIDPARKAIKDNISALPANTWVGLMNAQDGLRVLADPGPDRASVLAQIDALQTTGRPGLLEVVEPAEILAERVLRRAGVRNAVLFLTDSNIYNYREDYTNPVVNPSDSRDLSRRFPDALVREKTAKLAAALNSHHVPIFIQHLAWLRDRLNDAYETGLQQIAEATGGSAAFSRWPGDSGADIDQMVRRVTTHWAIDLRLPAGIGRTYTVQLAVAGREIQYRTKFTLAPQPRDSK